MHCAVGLCAPSMLSRVEEGLCPCAADAIGGEASQVASPDHNVSQSWRRARRGRVAGS